MTPNVKILPTLQNYFVKKRLSQNRENLDNLNFIIIQPILMEECVSNLKYTCLQCMYECISISKHRYIQMINGGILG